MKKISLTRPPQPGGGAPPGGAWRGEKTEKHVKEDQESAAEHKVVVDKRVETAGQGEAAGMMPAGHDIFYSEEDKREKGDDFGEVIELCVDDRKRGKGVQDGAEEGAGII